MVSRKKLSCTTLIKNNKYWLLLILVWLVLFVAYLFYWPPRPKGEIYSLHPLEDRSCLVIQDRWEDPGRKALILYKMKEDQNINWQIRLPEIQEKGLQGDYALWSDEENVYVNLPLAVENAKETPKAFQLIAYDLNNGKKAWETEPFQMVPEEKEWMIDVNYPELRILGTHDRLFTFHQYQYTPAPRRPTHKDARKMIIRAWNKDNGKLIWERDDLRPDTLAKPYLQNRGNDAAWQDFQKKKSLFATYPSSFLSAVTLPEHQLLFVTGRNGIRLAMDMETGETVGKLKGNGGGQIHTDGFYYALKYRDESRHTNRNVLRKYDFETRTFTNVPWWDRWQADSAFISVKEILSTGHYQGMDVFNIVHESGSRYGWYNELMVVDPEADTLVWSLLFEKDRVGHYPKSNESLEKKYPKNLPLSGNIKQKAPFYASMESFNMNYWNDYQTTFCMVDMEQRNFKVNSYFDPIDNAWVFQKDDYIYIYNGSNVFSVFDPETGKLEHSFKSNLFNQSRITPNSIRSGVIWAQMHKKVLVFHANTLELISGTEPIFLEVSSTTAEDLGLSNYED